MFTQNLIGGLRNLRMYVKRKTKCFFFEADECAPNFLGLVMIFYHGSSQERVAPIASFYFRLLSAVPLNAPAVKRRSTLESRVGISKSIFLKVELNFLQEKVVCFLPFAMLSGAKRRSETYELVFFKIASSVLLKGLSSLKCYV